jgi:long-subunit acyl-CoA synthetase (AMP-forming)
MTKHVALAQDTLCAAFQVTASDRPHDVALSLLDADQPPITWREYADRVRAIATGLHALGVRSGDAVCVMVQNRPEFHLVDTAVMHLGGTGCSLYNTTPAVRLAPMLENSGCRVVVTEQAFLPRMRDAVKLGGQVQTIVVVDPDGAALSDGEIGLADLEGLDGEGFDFEAAWRAVTPGTTACLCYSSGTTGEPKGVEFTHRALMFHVNSVERLAPPSPAGRVISYLPMAHMGERYMGHYSSLAFGYHVHCLVDGSAVGDHLREVRPTRFFGVPRVYEKVAAAAMAAVAQDPALSGPVAVLRDEVERRSAGETVTPTGERDRAYEALAVVRERVGLDRAEYLGLGAAGPPRELLVQLHSVGLPVLECYGLTEAIMVTANAPTRFRVGTVGVPMPGVETSLGADGELLVRGPGVFSRYRGRPDLTDETLASDGWMRTGDVAVIDPDGFHTIVDRKKELIVTATGKNVAPRLIENLLVQSSPLIANAVVVGDRRRHVAALLVLDGAELRTRGLGIDAAAADPDVSRDLEAAVEAVNAQISRAESVRSWSVLTTAWAPGGDELTDTGKLRRRAVEAKYAAAIDELYPD